MIDSASFDASSRTVKKGLASKKVTTTTQSSDSQSVIASTVAGDRVNVVATGGDISVRGSNIVSDNGTVVQATPGSGSGAGGNVTIGTLEARSSESQSVKVKKSGISFSGGGLFAGVAKNSNASTLETVTNSGSLVGSANGDVTINAGKALTVTGSQIAAPGTVTLSGESVTQTISRDTSEANQALTKQFADAKRADIAEGFAAVQGLTQQIGIFFNNRARDQTLLHLLSN